tara:strand:+ start:3650 stop:3979 length:330 start_codon:yes stop_codon:yes gene_type:complete
MKKDTIATAISKMNRKGLVKDVDADDFISGQLKGKFIERGDRLRHCHQCREPIPTSDAHVAFYHRSNYGQTRENMCMFCIDILSQLLKRRVPWRKRLKKRILDRVFNAL